MLGKADVPYEKMMMQLDSATGKYEDSGLASFPFLEVGSDSIFYLSVGRCPNCGLQRGDTAIQKDAES